MTPPEQQSFADKHQTLTFIALIAAPILALVSAIMGFVLIFADRTVAGVIFVLIPTQLFLVLGLWAYNARKKISSTPPPEEPS